MNVKCECRISQAALRWARMISLAVLIAFALKMLCGCAQYRIAGRIATPYGSVSSDGKTITIEARAGYAK